MTTAGKATWTAALGSHQGANRTTAPSKAFSSRDLPAHLTLKTRQTGQNTVDELARRDLKAELEEKERKHFEKKEDPHKRKLIAGPAFATEDDFSSARHDYADKDADDVDDDGPESDEDDEDDEDETAELMRELEKIKRERAEDQLRKEAEQAEKDEVERREAMLRGNPLLSSDTTFGAKRRWDDDVVFKNQQRGEKKWQKRFINDTIRSDFHKKFMHKYIK